MKTFICCFYYLAKNKSIVPTLRLQIAFVVFSHEIITSNKKSNKKNGTNGTMVHKRFNVPWCSTVVFWK